MHLEPVRWQDDWPIMGDDPLDKAVGQPVPSGPIPEDPPVVPQQRPQTSDEFDRAALGPQWEWNHNPDDARWSLSARPGYLRLIPGQAEGLLFARNTLTECMQDNAFEFTVRLDLSKMKSGAHAGLAMFEKSASGLELVQTGSERRLDFFRLPDRTPGPAIAQSTLQLRVRVQGDEAAYSYSLDDGASFHPLGDTTQIHFSWWKGSRPSLFAFTTEATDPGVIDFDWAHYEPLGANPW